MKIGKYKAVPKIISASNPSFQAVASAAFMVGLPLVAAGYHTQSKDPAGDRRGLLTWGWSWCPVGL